MEIDNKGKVINSEMLKSVINVNHRMSYTQVTKILVEKDKTLIKKYKDGEIPCNSQVISDIENVMKNVEPDLILTHYTEDYHQDHRAVAMATIAAARNRKALLFYQSYSAINFVPQIYVNIEEEIQDKKEILNCFTSQLRKNEKKGKSSIYS